MAQVYSERLIHGFGHNLIHAWTVPAGKRAVVRNVLAWAGAAGERYWLQLNSQNVRYWPSPGAGSTDLVETRLVAYEGETLSVYTDGTTIQVWVSGYVFADDGSLELVREERPLDPADPPIGWAL